ncbi:MAG: gamma-glutamyl-gamma-aminobutyrate hydrolase family protein [Deltaproteobacteria bacterium]|nr:gamma-glutamyl-gamma-aminobutyrate hydrolase family protein [Deltaproteobacteria bacterium]MBI3295411.1 gamma-glutamyl-gamma-aminobutyrate hydrolase family protein [Deltaproteobacteria bacterium]
MKRHIAIVDPAVQRPELNAFNQMSRLSPAPLTYHLPAMHGMQSLNHQPPDTVMGIVVLGSLASVHHKDPWQVELGQWLKPFLESGTPTLGICFGHQFIASLLGGTVGYARPDKTKYQGCRQISLSANPLWDNKPLQGYLCVSHEETVSSVPSEMEIVGVSQEIPTEVLAHKKLPVWTFQSHPEATMGFLERRKIDPGLPKPYEFGQRLVKLFLEFASRGR